MASDPFWPSVTAAAHLTEETLVDYAGNTISPYDGVVRVEDASAIGGYAMSYDGWYDSILINPEKDPNAFEPVVGSYGVRNFCVEARIFLTDGSSNRTIASRGTSTTTGWALFTYGGTGLMFSLYNPTGGTTFIQAYAAEALTLNAWHHVAACIETGDSGTVTRLFVDGVMVATEFGTSGEYAQPATNTAPLRIGSSGPAGTSFIGKIQEFRLTLDARYTADFAPPSALFGTEPVYFTGTVKDASGQPLVVTVRAHRRSDGASCGATDSNWMDGSFSAPAMDASPHYIVALINDENALIFDNVTAA